MGSASSQGVSLPVEEPSGSGMLLGGGRTIEGISTVDTLSGASGKESSISEYPEKGTEEMS